MRFARLAATLLLASPLAAEGAAAQQAPPSTDVFVAPLQRAGNRLIVGLPRNVTQRDGYDNQPAFTADSRAVLYTSVREDGQADIYRYDIGPMRTTRVTSTPESEYSATPTPDGRGFSVIRVERDSTQRLWRFPFDGGAPTLVLERVKPVGYHAWVDDTTLALFVLGQPATLQVASTRSGTAAVRARNIGRALLPLPRCRGYTYVARDASNEMTINVVPGAGHDVAGCGVTAAAASMPVVGSTEFHAVLPDGTLIAGAGARLLRWGSYAGTDGRTVSGWTTFADLRLSGVKNISRLAVSPDGNWLAFVAEAEAPAR